MHRAICVLIGKTLGSRPVEVVKGIPVSRNHIEQLSFPMMIYVYNLWHKVGAWHNNKYSRLYKFDQMHSSSKCFVCTVTCSRATSVCCMHLYLYMISR